MLKVRHAILSAYPYMYYTPETKLAFGAGGILTFYTAQDSLLRPSKVTASGYYTTTGQYKFSLDPQVYLRANRVFASLGVDYGYYVSKYWGIGNDTPDDGTEDYTSRAFGLDVNVQFPALLRHGTDSKLGFLYELSNTEIVDKKSNPNLVGDQPGADGGVASGLGLIWIWDSRDAIFYPRGGFYMQAKFVTFDEWIGSDFDYNWGEGDLRWYQSIGPRRVLAIQALVQAAGSGTPFYEMPALGGQRIMRGYYEGRYRDRVLLAGQAEIRFEIKGRLGAVAFAGLGDVAPDVSAFALGDVKTSLGGGLRFAFNKQERVNLRADVGFGQGTHGVYFGLEEAF